MKRYKLQRRASKKFKRLINTSNDLTFLYNRTLKNMSLGAYTGTLLYEWLSQDQAIIPKALAASFVSYEAIAYIIDMIPRIHSNYKIAKLQDILSRSGIEIPIDVFYSLKQDDKEDMLKLDYENRTYIDEYDDGIYYIDDDGDYIDISEPIVYALKGRRALEKLRQSK